MKKILLILLVLGISQSCKREVALSVDEILLDKNLLNLAANEAKSEFSRILSRAIYNEVELRRFIKKKALEMFDNDYDVFYHFVKDETVANGKTFREILLQYSDQESSLVQIENTLPLLTIYVPEMSAYGGFNVESWDVEDPDISVTPRNVEDKQVFFADGEDMLELDPSEIPGFPVLVVKTNEKLKISEGVSRMSSGKAMTKLSYEFLDEAYDRRKNPVAFAKLSSNDVRKASLQSTPVATNASFLASLVREYDIINAAWSAFGLDINYWQRDNIYYGATKTPQNATMNPNIREYINSLVFDRNLVSLMSLHPDNPRYTAFTIVSNSKNDPLSQEEVNRNLWTAGNILIKIDVITGNASGGTPSIDPKLLIIHPSKIFRYLRYTRKVTNPLFSSRRHSYSASFNDLISIPFYPENGGGIPLEQWNLANQSMSRTFNFTLQNADVVIDQIVSYRTTYVNTTNFNLTAGVDVSSAVRLGGSFGGSTSRTTEQTQSTTIRSTRSSQNLGSATFYFSDPVVTSQPGVRQDFYDNGPYTLNGVYTVTTGTVRMSLVPKPIR